MHTDHNFCAAGARIQRGRTTSASKTCRTIDGHREGKSQARKSYCKEWFLLPAELMSLNIW